MFAKYAGGRDYMTVYDVLAMLKGQRLVADPIGWGGAFFECEYYRDRPCLFRSFLILHDR